jgi:hypothetical protein
LQLAFDDFDARQIRGLKQRAQKFRVRFNKRAFKVPIKVALVSIEEESGSVAEPTSMILAGLTSRTMQ